MCIWCISTNKTHFIEEKFHKILSEIFFGCLSKKISNEKDVIVNKNILNKSKDLPFVRFFFKESTLASLSAYLRRSILRIIYAISKEQKSVQCIQIYCLNKERKHRFQNFILLLHCHFIYGIYSKIVCYSLFFTDSIAFTFNKRPDLHLISLFYKNCSFPTIAAYLRSLSSSSQFFVTERAVLVSKTSFLLTTFKN